MLHGNEPEPQRERDLESIILVGVLAVIYVASFVPAIFWLYFDAP